MTKKELKYVNSLKEENDRVKTTVMRFVDAVGKLKNIDDVFNMAPIPIMTEQNKKFREEIKAEAYKEFASEFEKRCIAGGIYPAFIRRQLENVKKELVGEQVPVNDVKCIDCKYLEFESPYAVCSKAYKGIVHPDDSCGKGKKRGG